MCPILLAFLQKIRKYVPGGATDGWGDASSRLGDVELFFLPRKTPLRRPALTRP